MYLEAAGNSPYIGGQYENGLKMVVFVVGMICPLSELW